MTEDAGNAIERGTDAHEECLLAGVKGKQIVTVRGNVVGRTAESHQPEEGKGGLHEMTAGQEERDACHGGANQKLHRHNPTVLAAEQFDHGTPEGFDDPGEIEPGGVESNLSVGETETTIHDGGDGHDNDVGDSFGGVETGNPPPGIAGLHVIWLLGTY